MELGTIACLLALCAARSFWGVSLALGLLWYWTTYHTAPLAWLLTR